jgi:hypothetical protein
MSAILSVVAAMSSRRISAPPAPDPEGIEASLLVEYIDQSGNQQRTTVASGSTTITGTAPFLVGFDATASRSESEGCDTVFGAFHLMGYRFNFGEGLGGNWPIVATPLDEYLGAPITHYAFTEIGSHTVRMRAKDPDDREQTITLTVVVEDPGAGTNISEGGSWPTWASNTVYNLAAGTDHSAKGNIDLNGLHNVLIRKTGEGADPIVSNFRPDARTLSGSSITQTKHCRLWGVDCASMTWGAHGHLYCGVIEGRCRTLGWAPGEYQWDHDVDTEQKALNLRWPRGCFFWRCGEINANAGGHIIITSGRSMVFRGVDLHKNSGGSGTHLMRGIYDRLDISHCRVWSTATVVTYMKIQGGGGGDDWPENDVVGIWGVGREILGTKYCNIRENQFGVSGDTNPDGNVQFEPESNDTELPDQYASISCYEDNVWFEATQAGANISLGGRSLMARNNLLNMGAGSNHGVTTSFNPNRIPDGWDGPYITSGTRPVPSEFT